MNIFESLLTSPFSPAVDETPNVPRPSTPDEDEQEEQLDMLSDDSWHPEEASAESSEDELDYVPAQKKAKKQGPNKFTGVKKC